MYKYSYVRLENMSGVKAKSLGNKVVLAKIPREEFTRFQQYCDRNGETINSSLRRMILAEIDNPHRSKIAGSSVFQYDKIKDNFRWSLELDDRTVVEIDDNLPADSLQALSNSVLRAQEERNTFIMKVRDTSVSLPSKLLGKRK